MKDKIEAVKKFHKAFGLGYAQKPTANLEPTKVELRYKLMQEENREYYEAAKNHDLVEIADALGDMLYVLCGTIIEHGMQDKMDTVFEEIQRSNMSKLGADGTPVYREDGKVMRGPDYCKPNIKKIVED